LLPKIIKQLCAKYSQRSRKARKENFVDLFYLRVFMMKALIKTNALFLLLLLFTFTSISNAQRPTAPAPQTPTKTEATDKTDLDTIGQLIDLNERVEKLKTFVQERPKSKLLNRALEMLSGARAAIADEKLRIGDNSGVEMFRLVVSESPANCSDVFFEKVLAQIPSNLFWRNEQTASIEIARMIEEKVKDNPTRLLVVAAFYLGVEAADDATRTAQNAITIAPNMSPAYQALGAAHRINFQLDLSAHAYAKAVELDPNSTVARKSLADIRRAQGRDEEALLLYRSLIEVDKTDEFARTGFIMSLFNMGKREDAENELKTALEETPNSLVLLTNAAYWYASKNEGEKAVEFAQKAVNVEPRYVWAQIALARGLIAAKRPLEAERALLFAKQYGSFPTLDYELATVLASIGLYDEAGRTLSRSFVVKDGMIETRLGNRASTKAESFIELLAAERRASIFQANPADSESNAKTLKTLLAFTLAINQPTKKEEEILAVSREFASIEDAMKTHRLLYVASRLLQNDIALSQALNFTQESTSGLEASLDIPSATVAVMADELYDVRANAAANGSTANLPDVPRGVLSNIMRGKIEDIAGWTLFNQKKFPEAIIRLRRALTVLPENSAWWRSSIWHLGAAYEANGNQKEALAFYYKSYNSKPDANRRTIIEALYKKVNGTLDGLDKKIGESPFAPTKTVTGTETANNNTVASLNGVSRPSPSPVIPPSLVEEKPAATTEVKTEPTPVPSPLTETKTETEQKKDPLPEVKTDPTSQPSETKPSTENKPETTPENKVENKTETPAETKSEKKDESKTEPTQTPEVKKEPSSTETNPTQTEEKKPSEEQTAKVENKIDETNNGEKKSDETAKTESKPDEIKVEEKPKTEGNPTETTQPATTETKTETKSEPNSTPGETKTVESSVDRNIRKRVVGDETKKNVNTEETTPTQTRPRIVVGTNKPIQPKNDAANKTTDDCSITVSQESLSVLNNGGTVSLTVELYGMPSDGNITVENEWTNIAVFLEPKVRTDGRSALFSITSVSKNTGIYTVTFKSPCGSKSVTVKVR